MKKHVLSIITVCRQAREALKTTMDQILLQSWREFEYLVIDGSSSDGTQELLTDYTGRFADAGISCRFLSEPDHGIYDAMNKGTRLAHGTWLLFLNAGDLLSGPDILQQIFGTPLASDIQILYGDTLCTYQNHQKPYPALPLDHITFEMPFCHQSAFIRRELLAAHPYDVSYKVCADHQFFLNMYLQKKTFSYRRVFRSEQAALPQRKAAHAERTGNLPPVRILADERNRLLSEIRDPAPFRAALCGSGTKKPSALAADGSAVILPTPHDIPFPY